MRSISIPLPRSVAFAAAFAGLTCCATTPGTSDSSPRTARVAPVQQDIETTGAVQPGQALSLLDPGVTAH